MSSKIISYDRNDPDDAIFGDKFNETGIRPLGYKILVRITAPEYIERAKQAGLVMAETAEARHTFGSICAQVVQIGSGAYSPERYPEGPWCAAGDWVVMSPYSGTRIKSPITNDELRIINEDSIEAVVPSPDFVDRGNA